MDAVIEIEEVDPNPREKTAGDGGKEEEVTGKSDDELEPIVKREKICVKKQLQILCDLYGYREETYWDCYQPDQKDALTNKLSLIVSNEFVSEKNLVIWQLDKRALSCA